MTTGLVLPLWLTRAEAAGYARVSLATIDRWARARKIRKHITAGGRGVRFTADDLNNAMTSGTSKS